VAEQLAGQLPPDAVHLGEGCCGAGGGERRRRGQRRQRNRDRWVWRVQGKTALPA
jgi:hypothetical protein